MLNVYVIGCGGIGGYLINMLPMAIASATLDWLERRRGSDYVSNVLKDAGNLNIPCVVDRLTLIDADIFDPKNAVRQENGAGNKLVQRMLSIDQSLLRKTFLRNMQLVGYNEYVKPANISEMIPAMPKLNPQNEELAAHIAYEPFLLSSVIFLCVDNMKTRYEVSKYVETFRDVIVFNGGNSKTAGHVTIYERSNGKALDPNLPELFENCRPDVDKRPDEEACTMVSPKHDQIAITNSMVANVMLGCFMQWVREGDIKVKDQRKNEIMFDIGSFSMFPLYHPINRKEGEL